jgi:hypothetical protein
LSSIVRIVIGCLFGNRDMRDKGRIQGSLGKARMGTLKWEWAGQQDDVSDGQGIAWDMTVHN